ncbi:MAG: 4Fe-4S dicluster domain-containing protein [Ruminococcaceae bacterium]|nr:4Fe-4S dicluster domain-containing protein [Oscillospiraceae bacterium]
MKTKLGFGCMRLPKVGDEVDIEAFSQMVDTYMQAGGNYFDTAHVYHGGRSEIALREGLTKRYPRESYVLTNKLTTICFEEEKDLAPLFESQLEACGVAYFDNYFFHAMRTSYYEKFKRVNAFDFVKQLKAAGKIRHIGMSFHDSPEFLQWVLENHPEIELVQLQFNYADKDNPDVESLKCYDICEAFGKPVVVMEPVKGGTLANLPQEGKDLLQGRNEAAFALRYCASFPQIKVVLSGMSDLRQMQENLDTFVNVQPFTQEEFALADELRMIVRRLETIPCTSCRYCTDGCPANIPIPEIFEAYNARKLRQDYHADISAIAQCLDCGACEGLCPQKIEIRKYLKRAAQVLK